MVRDQSDPETREAEARNWRICPTCHGAKQRSRTRSRSDVLNRVTALDSRIEQEIADEIAMSETLQVSCTRTRAGSLCGYVRTITMRSLFHKTGGNGCPVCAGNTLTPEIIAERAALFGLTAFNILEYENLNTHLHFRCADGHSFTNTWSNQRNRGCPKCTRSTGERLLMAVCEILWPDGQWQSEYTVFGLDPLDPERRPHRYDVASPVYQVVIENHSPLHDKEGHAFYQEGRLRDDALKEQAVDAGGKLEGWSYAVFRWSEEEIEAVLQRADNMAKALMDDLQAALARQRRAPWAKPFLMPDRAPPTASEFLRAHSDLRRHTAILEKAGLVFLDGQFWAGRNRTYRYRCTRCGYEETMGARTVEDREHPCQSCGDWQTWEGFVHACAKAGYPIIKPSALVDTKDSVSLRCEKHDQTIFYLRSTVSERLRTEPKKLCAVCADELPSHIHRRPGDMASWHQFVATMNQYGWDVPEQEWRGSSISGGGIERYQIIHRVCQGEKWVGIHQARQKAEKNGSDGCDTCKARARHEAFAALVDRYGLQIAPGETVVDTRTPVRLLCTRAGCERGGSYCVSADNLRRKGPACDGCRAQEA